MSFFKKGEFKDILSNVAGVDTTKITKGFISNVMATDKSQMAQNILSQIQTTTYDEDGQKKTFMGINAPFFGNLGITISPNEHLRFGRFNDPREKLRNRNENKAIVPPDFGLSSDKPVPATRGGDISQLSLSFDHIRESLLAEHKLFEDPDFPAIDSSLYFSQRPPRKIEWLRPSQIIDKPMFFSEGASRFDVRQGELGDCWLLAAIASLSMHQDLFSQVVPEQTFEKDYCGLFRFNFWYFGEWKEIVVDDRLPSYRGQLLYMHSTEKGEFWSALMEKAYAKLCGSYEALKGGTTCEALEDFTGGIAEMFDLRDKTPPSLMDIMLKAQEHKSLMACSIQADPKVFEARLSNGLIMGHAYSVTSVKLLDISLPGKTGKIPLIRVRNPWGNEAEWKGAWSDKSREWSLISDVQRKDLGIVFEDDGEFWMSYKDFTSNFEKLEICHLGPQSFSSAPDEHGHVHTWVSHREDGEWVARVNAGGCRNFLETFWTNPQFCVKVVDPDEDDSENKGCLIIGLMQKERRRKRKEGQDLLTIGYAIYKLPEDSTGHLGLDFFKFNASVARSPAFINLREVCGRHRLEPGNYLIVPSSYQPNEEALFILRIFSENKHHTEEIDEKTKLTDPSIRDSAPIPIQPPVKKSDVTPQPIKEAQSEALRRAFEKVAGDDQEIDADELMDILNVAFKKDFEFSGFSLESCRSMISMMDFDRSGRLDFKEFQSLWEHLRIWKTAFKKFDLDKTGTMNSMELRLAMKSVGYCVSNSVLSSLVLRFSRRDGTIPFDDYVICCSRMKTCFETFAACDKADNGMAIFDEDTFLNTVTYV